MTRGTDFEFLRCFPTDVGLMDSWTGNTEVKSNIKSTKCVCQTVENIPKYRRKFAERRADTSIGTMFALLLTVGVVLAGDGIFCIKL